MLMILVQWILHRIQNHLSQYHLGEQFDLYIFGAFVSNSAFFKWHVHQWGEMNFCARRPCFIDHLFLTSDFRQVPRRNFPQFVPFLVHCCLCCWIEDWTFEGIKSTLSKTLITLRDCLRPWFVWGQTTGLPVLSWFGVVFPRTKTIRSPESRAGSPSNLNPASNEMISDSAELWDTDVCFLHIQLVGTIVLLPKKKKRLSLKLILSHQGRQQSQSLGINPIDNAEPCCPHDNIVGSHLCDECKKSILLVVCHMPESS